VFDIVKHAIESTMHRIMRTKRMMSNQAGTISNCVQTEVKVLFDLVETQDFVDGVPDLEFSFGNLRFGDEASHQISSLAHHRAPLVLSGGGIQTTILLNGPNAFTVMSVIKEIQIHEAALAA
jgi:hypothetical protein